MSGKIHAKKPISQATGPTFDHNDPLKFTNHGKTSGKTMSNGVVNHGKGATQIENSTHIPTMNADVKAEESKVMSEKAWFDPHSTNKPRSANDQPVMTNASKGLKSEYRK